MAVAVGSKARSLGGRSSSKDVDFAAGYVSPIYTNNSSQSFTRGHSRSLSSQKKLTVLTSARALGNVSASANSPQSSKQSPGLPHGDANMTSFSNISTIPARSESRLAKLHKRASSGSSLPASPSPLVASQSQFTTPYTESQTSTPTQPSNSSFKTRPYIRKLSSAKDDSEQGRLDLSKSVSETGYIPGLGIQDYGSRTASEVTFSHTSRRAAHTRTTSCGSQVSVSSRSFTPTQPFVHPMRQTPNSPYTPSGQSYASSVNEDEASDIVGDDPIVASQPFRSRRSESISSVPRIQPTPLSQSHTVTDFYSIPKYSGSQTNLSTKSSRSGKSSRSKLGRRSRRNTERSDDPSGRTSIDKAISFISKRSDNEPQTRDEKIREKRRQFNEKEASKDLKLARSELKRRETDEARSSRQARKSSLSKTEQTAGISEGSKKISSIRKTTLQDSEKAVEELRSRSYDSTRPANLTALPAQAVVSEKVRRSRGDSRETSGTWPRFSTWVQTRVLSCGGKG